MIRRLIVFAVLAFFAVPAFAAGNEKTLRVYFIGNSVTDTINYGGLAELAKGRGYTLVWGRHVIPGAPLQWIWEHPEDGFQEPPFGYYVEALTKYPWDVLCLQPFDRRLEGTGGDLAMAKKFIDLALKKSPGLRVYVFARWPRKGKDDFETAWLKKYSGNWDGTNESQDYFERLTLELRKTYPKLEVNLVPVGHVLYGLDRWMKAGKIPGYTDVHQLYADDIHLNAAGSYAVGCTVLQTFYKQSARRTVPGEYHLTDGKLAATIRDVTWRVVSYDELAGVSDYFKSIEWKIIADVQGGDRITEIHIANLLGSHDIETDIWGNFFHGVRVPRQKAEAALRLLREDAPKRCYWIRFDEKGTPSPPEPTPRTIRCLSVAQLMTQPEFADDRPLGRWLRSGDLPAALRKYPFVKCLNIVERQYLGGGDALQTGYELKIELCPSAGEQSKWFDGRYQVWAEGKGIDGFSNESPKEGGAGSEPNSRR